tara:strand:- start:304 stop:1257 length:954 start_codon:yes stop_codon:yes gene_type:complete
VKFKNIKIVFMGTAEFGIPTLKVLNDNFKLNGIITNYDKPSGRGLKIKFSPVKKFAIENNIKYLQPKNLKNEDFIKKIKSLNPDFIIVVAFRMIPEKVWKIPKHGTINLHASLLPNYRGSAPINWVIINNEQETGVTTFFIDENIDTGDILLQRKIKIDNKINAGDLHDKLKDIGAEIVFNTIDGILKRKIKKIKQKENRLYKTAYKFDKENIKLNWNLNGIDIYNKIRGLSPFPGSRTTISSTKGDNKKVVIYGSDYIVESHDLENGIISTEKDIIKITCSDGYIIIKDLKVEGKKRMDAKSFLNGFNLENYYIAK